MIAGRLRKAVPPLAVAAVLFAGTAMAQQGQGTSPGMGMGPGPDQGSGMMHGQDMHRDMPGSGPAAPAKPKDPASRGYMESMRKMNHGMRMPMTGNADQDFARMMVAHHQGAIDMARVELQHGKDPELKAVAQKVIDDQTREIQQLQDWLKQHPAKQAAK